MSEGHIGGHVAALVIGPKRREPLTRVPQVHAFAGRGLEGDRYLSTILYGRASRDLTLIELEAIEALRETHGVVLGVEEARRNVVTRGVRLDTLVGRRFRLGEVECIGIETCPPCPYLERLTRPGVMGGLDGRGGLRASISTDGVIRTGDPLWIHPYAGAPAEPQPLPAT